MKTAMFAIALLALAACDPYPMTTEGPDACATVSLPTGDRVCVEDCAQWGMSANGDRFCLSTEPDPCPGPWGCAEK